MEDLKVGTYYRPIVVPDSLRQEMVDYLGELNHPYPGKVIVISKQLSDYLSENIQNPYLYLSDTEKIDRLNKEMSILWDTPSK